MELMLERSKVESQEKWRDWRNKIPALHFESNWEVKIIPPFLGALVRFYITNGENWVSVYLDGFCNLGWMVDSAGDPIPYYEVYDGEDCRRYFLDETDEMMYDIRNILNKEKNKKTHEN